MPRRTQTIILSIATAIVFLVSLFFDLTQQPSSGLKAKNMAAEALIPQVPETHEIHSNDTLTIYKSVRTAEQKTAAAAIAAEIQLQLTYKVRAGDTLSGIAHEKWGHASDWPALWYANRKKITNPVQLVVGEILRVPASSAVPPAMLHAALAAIPKPPPPPAPAPAPSQSAPAPAAAPPPPSGGGIYGFSALEALWVSAGGPGWAEAQAAQIALCESGGNPGAQNGSGATGLWQILGQVVPGNLFDPMVNALNAVSKFNASGQTFAQWVCQ